MDDIINRIPEIFSKIDALYISSKFIDVINEQSCDCDELIISNDNHFFKLTYCPTNDENAHIVFEEIDSFDRSEYPYEVALGNDVFVYDKMQLINTSLVEGIRFKFKQEYLFIFALDCNLVITKSKADLFDDATDYTVYEKEATLTILKNF